MRTTADESVAVITVCAAPAPAEDLSPFAQSLHRRWSAMGDFDRAAEDIAALSLLGATPIHLTTHDCIYRRAPDGNWLYESEQAIFGGLSPHDQPLIDSLAGTFGQTFGDSKPPLVVAPRGLGNHVDHALVRAAAERWASRVRGRLKYYADYPYAASLPAAGGNPIPLTAEVRQVKVSAVRAYASQLSTFWQNEQKMENSVLNWAELMFD